MRNHSGEVPIHLRSAYETMSEELCVASEVVFSAETRHRDAILTRITFGSESVTQWTDIINELQRARSRYGELVAARIALTRAINGES